MQSLHLLCQTVNRKRGLLMLAFAAAGGAGIMAAGILKDKDEPVVQIRTTGEGPGREYAGKALAPQSRTYAGKPGADRAVTAAHVAPAAMQSFPVPDDFSRKRIGLVCGRRGGPLSAGQAAVWRRDLEAIIQGGDALVPAMAEFLQTGKDTIFSPEECVLTGYRSAREALLDALAASGGPEARALLVRELAATGSPREVALIAGMLEQAAPGQYHGQALAAARELLAMAGTQQLGNADIAPLFEVLQIFGGTAAAPELEAASARWGQYAAHTLSGLPDGSGLPALLRLVGAEGERRPVSARLPALQAVAQLSGASAEAGAALLTLASRGEITSTVWPYLSKPLSGQIVRLQEAVFGEPPPPAGENRENTVHIASGNQNLVWVQPAEGQTAEDYGRRVEVLNALLAVTKDPVGRRVIENARELLDQHQATVAIGTPQTP